ncbi:Uncharacterised protein [uncultured archaeon]|nr:Uncharacterised protein [uncultured archaeon]
MFTAPELTRTLNSFEEIETELSELDATILANTAPLNPSFEEISIIPFEKSPVRLLAIN